VTADFENAGTPPSPKRNALAQIALLYQVETRTVRVQDAAVPGLRPRDASSRAITPAAAKPWHLEMKLRSLQLRGTSIELEHTHPRGSARTKPAQPRATPPSRRCANGALAAPDRHSQTPQQRRAPSRWPEPTTGSEEQSATRTLPSRRKKNALFANGK